MKQRIGEMWASYESEVLPARAHDVERMETKRAFYAGAQGLLSAILKGLTPGTEPEEADLRMMDEIEAEIRAFGEDVGEGRA